MDTPNNLSIFLLRVKDPTTLNEQQARGMELHILEAGKDHNKEVMEIIQASKKKIILPTTFEDLTTIVKGFGGIASILFGGGSILPTNLRQFIARELNINKTLIKGKIAMDKTLIAQIMYTIDSRTQLYFSYLRRANDLDEVNISITDFTPMANDLMLGQFHVVLPATFAQPKVAKDDENEHDGPPRGGRGKRRKKAAGSGTPLGEIEGDRRDDNKNIPQKENESYKDVFVNRHIQERPKWNTSCAMCPRWWIIGKCYRDCNNVESHVNSSDLPSAKKSAFIEYLEICRRG